MPDALERQLSLVESLFVLYGAVPQDINQRNRQLFGQRRPYLKDGVYYRADSACFDGQQVVIISSIDSPAYAEKGVMEDIDAFPADLPTDQVNKRVRYALGLTDDPDL